MVDLQDRGCPASWQLQGQAEVIQGREAGTSRDPLGQAVTGLLGRQVGRHWKLPVMWLGSRVRLAQAGFRGCTPELQPALLNYRAQPELWPQFPCLAMRSLWRPLSLSVLPLFPDQSQGPALSDATCACLDPVCPCLPVRVVSLPWASLVPHTEEVPASPCWRPWLTCPHSHQGGCPSPKENLLWLQTQPQGTPGSLPPFFCLICSPALRNFFHFLPPAPSSSRSPLPQGTFPPSSSLL